MMLEKIQGKLVGWKGKLLSTGAKVTLIKNVLQAMPLYYLALIDPPKVMLKSLDKMFANFFRNNNDGSDRIHWIRWTKICLPCEGGLGLRNVQDVSNAFVIKLWWRFRENKSIWTSYMHTKYCKDTHPNDTQIPPKTSITWKRMVRTRTYIDSCIRWIVSDGEMDIFKDKWL